MQPENKNDGVQLSSRYEQYLFAKRHLRGTSRPKVFPIGESSANDIEQLNSPTHSNDRIYGIEGIGPTLNTMQGGRRQPKIAPTMRANHHNTADVHFISTKSAEAEDVSNCKTDIKRIAQIRRLTPTECERLMSYPDGWTEGLSDTQRYKCLGNGIVSNVVEEIIRRL